MEEEEEEEDSLKTQLARKPTHTLAHTWKETLHFLLRGGASAEEDFAYGVFFCGGGFS